MRFARRSLLVLASLVLSTGCNLFEQIEEPIGATFDDAGHTVSGDSGTTMLDMSSSSCALDEIYRERIDPRETYLRTENDPDALDASKISLGSLGLEAGDRIRIRFTGSYEAGGQRGRVEGGLGVFSANGDLRPSFFLDRVPEAIDAGEDFESLPTHIRNEPTDIDQDFAIDDVVVSIPSGASFLLVGAHDSRYSDNFSVDDDPYTLVISCP